jgi:hypothetical protein
MTSSVCARRLGSQDIAIKIIEDVNFGMGHSLFKQLSVKHFFLHTKKKRENKIGERKKKYSLVLVALSR